MLVRVYARYWYGDLVKTFGPEEGIVWDLFDTTALAFSFLKTFGRFELNYDVEKPCPWSIEFHNDYD